MKASVLWNIEFGDRTFRLSQPLVVTVVQDHGTWVHECDELNLLAHGNSEACSFHEFVTDFAFSWDGLVHEPDESLTIDAQKLKQRLLNHVKAVEPK